jgi:hypothetical protein
MSTDKVAAMAAAFAAKQPQKFGQTKYKNNKTTVVNTGAELNELRANIKTLNDKVEFLEKALFSLIEVIEQLQTSK